MSLPQKQEPRFVLNEPDSYLRRNSTGPQVSFQGYREDGTGSEECLFRAYPKIGLGARWVRFILPPETYLQRGIGQGDGILG